MQMLLMHWPNARIEGFLMMSLPPRAQPHRSYSRILLQKNQLPTPHDITQKKGHQKKGEKI